MPGEKREAIGHFPFLMTFAQLEKRNNERNAFLTGLIVISAILSLDRITKFLAVTNLSLNQSVPVIKGVIHFTLVHNRGAAFGILKNQLHLFIFSSISAIILIYFSLRNIKERRPSFYSVSLSLILAGAIGNLIDRIFLGYVIDFLDLRIWPVFNVADSAITVGAGLLGYSILKPKRITDITEGQG